MMSIYDLQEINKDDYCKALERIKKYKSNTLFHHPNWLEYLERIGKGTPKYYEIHEGERNIGYFVFLELNYGPFRIMGSPLPGWTTNYMGPVIDDNANQEELISAIVKLIKKEKYIYSEIRNEILEPSIMRKAGFISVCDQTAVFHIPESEDTAWKMINNYCRNRIRKGINNKLKVQNTEDIDTIRVYYDMIVARYEEQGMRFPFKISRLETLRDCLHASKNILILKVKYGDSTIAAGLFPYDDNCIYYFGGASNKEYNKLCPNELMHWSVIQNAVKMGIKKYNMCGTSRFKRKFGTIDTPHISYVYSPIPGFIHIRRVLYETYWKILKLKKVLYLV